VGSVLGLALAVVALLAPSREGHDVAWAAVVANVFALLTLIPGAAGLLTYRHAPRSGSGSTNRACSTASRSRSS
jgi:hypothetical protein